MNDWRHINVIANIHGTALMFFTGEAWQDIMMGVSPEPTVKCDKNYQDEEGGEDADAGSCGSVLAFPYFISFYVLCSFLVSHSS